MNVDAQALAETVKAGLPECSCPEAHFVNRCATCIALDALDELVLAHTRQEEAKRGIASEARYALSEAELGDWHDATEAIRRICGFLRALPPPPVEDDGYSEHMSELDVPAAEMGWDGSTTAAERAAPPPVASGVEGEEDAQFTPEAWEKLTQQHQTFLARRSVASEDERKQAWREWFARHEGHTVYGKCISHPMGCDRRCLDDRPGAWDGGWPDLLTVTSGTEGEDG